MPVDVHTIEVGDGSTFSTPDRVKVRRLAGITNASGGSNGTAVTTAVTVSPVDLPTDYSVFVDTKGNNCWAYVTSKTAAGFNVVLQPSSTVTVAAGSFDVLIMY